MSNHRNELYTYAYFTPYKANTRPNNTNNPAYNPTYNPALYRFDCHYGSRILTVRAEGPYTAREKAAKYFKTGADKIIARRV
jgi:hypothetical protein